MFPRYSNHDATRVLGIEMKISSLQNHSRVFEERSPLFHDLARNCRLSNLSRPDDDLDQIRGAKKIFEKRIEGINAAITHVKPPW